MNFFQWLNPDTINECTKQLQAKTHSCKHCIASFLNEITISKHKVNLEVFQLLIHLGFRNYCDLINKTACSYSCIILLTS